MIQNRKEQDKQNLFDKTKEDYYAPIKAKSAFDDNYIEYESRGDKDKHFLLQNYLDIIKPFLRDIIDDYKARGE